MSQKEVKKHVDPTTAPTTSTTTTSTTTTTKSKNSLKKFNPETMRGKIIEYWDANIKDKKGKMLEVMIQMANDTFHLGREKGSITTEDGQEEFIRKITARHNNLQKQKNKSENEYTTYESIREALGLKKLPRKEKKNENPKEDEKKQDEDVGSEDETSSLSSMEDENAGLRQTTLHKILDDENQPNEAVINESMKNIQKALAGYKARNELGSARAKQMKEALKEIKKQKELDEKKKEYAERLKQEKENEEKIEADKKAKAEEKKSDPIISKMSENKETTVGSTSTGTGVTTAPAPVVAPVGQSKKEFVKWAKEAQKKGTAYKGNATTKDPDVSRGGLNHKQVSAESVRNVLSQMGAGNMRAIRQIDQETEKKHLRYDHAYQLAKLRESNAAFMKKFGKL